MAAPATRHEALSKLLFNAQHRLSVAKVFLDEPTAAVSCEDVAARAEVSRSVAHKELHVLTAIGAMQRIEASRSVYFQRLPSSFWGLSEELLHAAVEVPQTS